MPRLLLAILLAALAAPADARTTDPWAIALGDRLLLRNDADTADAFLASPADQARLKALDAEAYLAYFTRATELRDLRTLLRYEPLTARSLRLALLERERCTFCRDPRAFTQWAELSVPKLGASGRDVLETALWQRHHLSEDQKRWLLSEGLDAGWERLDFKQRHAALRRWALAERDAALAVNPGGASRLAQTGRRLKAAGEVLNPHEMADANRRYESSRIAVGGLEDAERRAAASNDPRIKTLLQEAKDGRTPEARLAALSRFYEGLGLRSAELSGAAPARDASAFDDAAYARLSSLLGHYLMRETAGTWAEDVLRKQYPRGPTIAIARAELDFAAWYHPGSGVITFNQASIETYLKLKGLTPDAVSRDPAQLQSLARGMVPLFVHEATHEGSYLWSHGRGLPFWNTKNEEAQAYQAEGLFTLEKLRADPEWLAFVVKEAPQFRMLAGALARARRLQEGGVDGLDAFIEGGHYPEVLTAEARTWCYIVWHNDLKGPLDAELARRAALPAEERRRLAELPAAEFLESATLAEFATALRRHSTAVVEMLRTDNMKQREMLPEIYAAYRARRESVARHTREGLLRLDAPGVAGR